MEKGNPQEECRPLIIMMLQPNRGIGSQNRRHEKNIDHIDPGDGHGDTIQAGGKKKGQGARDQRQVAS
ncbi:MAG: hypothetical protein HQL07_16185 [Nitrospirae bacterium]|nr:hypothetical protein [Magnetococcales bacterium]HAT49770.1 hypothetical protein [Alphaproteobacteria bacterium]